LGRVQDSLFSIGAGIALPPGQERSEWGILAIADEQGERNSNVTSTRARNPYRRSGVHSPRGEPGGGLAAPGADGRPTAERRCVTSSATNRSTTRSSLV